MATEAEQKMWREELEADLNASKPTQQTPDKRKANVELERGVNRVNLEFSSAFPDKAELEYSKAILSSSLDVLSLVQKDKKTVLDWSIEEFLSVLDDYMSGAKPKPEGCDNISLENLQKTILELMDAKTNPLPKGNILGQLSSFFETRINELAEALQEQNDLKTKLSAKEE